MFSQNTQAIPCDQTALNKNKTILETIGLTCLNFEQLKKR